MATLNQNQIRDISFDDIKREQFRIDGGDSRILELNTSDFGIAKRLSTAEPKLLQWAQTAFTDLPQLIEDGNGDITDESFTKLGDVLQTADTQLREIIDYIFDSDVSAKCAPHGYMYDVINGNLRFEVIIDKLSQLYQENISREMSAINDRIKQRTAKYTKKKR
jgi:hypothetical protein